MSQVQSSNTVISSVATGKSGSEISGISAPFSLVKIFEGLRLIGEAVASADGAWSLPWLGSPDASKHAFKAIGSHDHRQPHPRHHDTPVSAGAPSIAGISDSAQGSQGKFAHATTIKNPLPTIIGFGHAGDVITVFDGDRSIGSTTVHTDGTWTFSTPLLAKGSHDFFVSAVSAVSGITLISNHLVVHMVGGSIPAPSAIATITSALDEFSDPAGNHHLSVVENGSKTANASPKLLGTLDSALHQGEVLVVYRDGVKLGQADVRGTSWSFQDKDLAAGSHVYAARVESEQGVQGAVSQAFSIVEGSHETTLQQLPMFVTQEFLIIDARLFSRDFPAGTPGAFDLRETVKLLEKQGMHVKSYSDNNGLISFEVDWMAYAAGHPNEGIEFISHQHLDNAKGGLDYYNGLDSPLLGDLLSKLNSWVTLNAMADGPSWQSPLPPSSTLITGIFSEYVDQTGGIHQSLIPEGGLTSDSTHKIVGTISEPLRMGSDNLVIYRDGVKLSERPHVSGTPGMTLSGTDWWIVDSDVPPGKHVYTARVERLYGNQGAWSQGYEITDIAPAPSSIATISNAIDEFIDPNGVHHDDIIQAGGKTADTSPLLHGTISAALNEGEVLAIYRDGQKIGTASVTGLGWSYQDEGLGKGQHVYTARVESASGGQGTPSADFAIHEMAGTTLSTFPMLATKDFLIFDTRLIPRTTSDGTPISLDLMEGVKCLEKAGMTVKSYTDYGGIICIEVNWMAYAKEHLNEWIDFVSHRHVDNNQGGLNFYDTIGVPPFDQLMNKLGTWVTTGFGEDGAAMQSASPAAAALISGVFDSYIDAEGHVQLSLVPTGGASGESSHRIEGTISEPMRMGSDWLVVYRDGVKLAVDNHSFDFGANYSNTTWWIVDNDVPPGPHAYTARVERSYGDQGTWSQSYEIQELAPAPLAVATITSAIDEFIDPNGVHHDNIIQAGGKTADTSPLLHGTISVALNEGEVLAVYRDGQRIGTASVTALGWSYQDEGLTAGQHVYTACIVSTSGEQGVHSGEFAITETAGTGGLYFQVLATEDFLIFDTRLSTRTSSDGKAISIDLFEGVKMLEAAGMTVKSYTDNGGIISIEVDWVAYVKAHPDAYFDLVLRRHIDNDQGGLNYYNPITVPDFGILLKSLGTWEETHFVLDAGGQSPTPAATAMISGIFDSYVDTEGQAQLSLVPMGGASSASSHRVEGTLSEPMRSDSDWLVIYRDGVKLAVDNHSFDFGANYSNTTWWIIDNDVPPGPHVYTARVERSYGDQGAWSQGYGIQEPASIPSGDKPRIDPSSARMMLTADALVVDTSSWAIANADGSSTAVALSLEIVAGGKTLLALHGVETGKGLVSFAADWRALLVDNPGAKLIVSAQDGETILDKHVVSALKGAANLWITMKPDGESELIFDPFDRGTRIHGNSEIDTIPVAGDHQTLDFTSLTGKTTGSIIAGIEKIDLGGQANTLKIAMIDVLNLGEVDLFRADGKQQLLVNGKNGDSIELSNTRVAGIDPGEWEQQPETKVCGVTYSVYEHSTAHVELLVQSGVQLFLH
jgi:hypothetical protein